MRVALAVEALQAVGEEPLVEEPLLELVLERWVS